MNFTTEEIAQTRKELSGATNWDNPVGISEHLDALTVIEQQRAEIARLTAFLHHIMTLGLLRGSSRLRDEALKLLDSVEASDATKTSSDKNKLDTLSLQYAAQWIENSLVGETNERVIEFGKNMAMSIRAAISLNRVVVIKPADPSLEEDDTCPECGGSGAVAGDYFSDDGMSPCARCNGKGGEE